MHLYSRFYISRYHKVLLQKPCLKPQRASNVDVEALPLWCSHFTVGEIFLAVSQIILMQSIDTQVFLHLNRLLFGVLGWVSVQHFEISADVRRTL
jgi:hypothetical protein